MVRTDNQLSVRQVALEPGGVGPLGIFTLYSVLDLTTFLSRYLQTSSPYFIPFKLTNSSSQKRLIIEHWLNSTMIMQIWYLLASGLLPVAFVAANPDCGVGFELTADYG